MSHDYFLKLKAHFDDDDNKTWDWFNNPNALLGGLTPFELVKRGREGKVKRLIDKMIRGY